MYGSSSLENVKLDSEEAMEVWICCGMGSERL